MKKSILFLAVFFAGSLFFPVFSESKTEQEVVSERKSKKQEKLKRAKELAEERFRTNAVSDEYLNILYLNEKKYKVDGNFLSLQFENSAFNLQAKTDSGRYVSLLSNVNQRATDFHLNIDGTVYYLNQGRAVKRYIRQTSEGAQLAYIQDRLFQAVIDFKPVATKEGRDEDAVLVTVNLTNLSTQDHYMALRGIFDTVLGENSSAHFVTFEGEPVNSETMFTEDDVNKIRYLLSSDSKNSLQIMLSGKNISPLERVIVAHPEVLKKMAWDGNISRRRSFNNAASYNDSAVMIEWKGSLIEPKATVSDSFYFFAATDGGKCKGIYFLDGVEEPPERVVPEPPVEMPAVEKPAENPPKKEPKKNDASLTKASGKPVSKKVQKSDKRTDVDFVVPPIKEYQLDPQYIQNLIDKIDSLQSDSKNVNKAEINKLNAELDAILNVLRQM